MVSHIFDSQTTELSEILHSACKKLGSYSVVCQEPDEYRVAQYLQKLKSNALDIRFESSEHFISSPSEFQEMFKGKKSFLMETFYRKLRKRTGLLMDGKEPPDRPCWLRKPWPAYRRSGPPPAGRSNSNRQRRLAAPVWRRRKAPASLPGSCF